MFSQPPPPPLFTGDISLYQNWTPSLRTLAKSLYRPYAYDVTRPAARWEFRSAGKFKTIQRGAAVLCRLSEADKTNEDPSSFQNSCTGLQRFDSPESNGNSPLSSTSTSKRSGGFTYCGIKRTL